jgi:hypothetical protein
MKSKPLGKNILPAEVTQITANGIWLLVANKEYFIDYESYPWFKNGTVNSILNVKLLHGFHLHWPDLDVDLELDCLENEQNYPLIYK